MLVVYESKLSVKDYNKYKAKGYRVASIFDRPVISKNESVGIVLTRLYKTSIDLINDLLFKKHTVTLLFEGKSYVLHSLDDWYYSYQDPKDQLRMTSYKHPILQRYYQNIDEYRTRQHATQLNEYRCTIENALGTPPSAEELDSLLDTFVPLYQLDVDYNNYISKILAYHQIKYYLDHDIPYANAPRCIDYHEEPMFQGLFQDVPPDDYEEIHIQDETLLEDIVYKCSTSSTNINNLLDSIAI